MNCTHLISGSGCSFVCRDWRRDRRRIFEASTSRITQRWPSQTRYFILYIRCDSIQIWKRSCFGAFLVYLGYRKSPREEIPAGCKYPTRLSNHLFTKYWCSKSFPLALWCSSSILSNVSMWCCITNVGYSWLDWASWSEGRKIFGGKMAPFP